MGALRDTTATPRLVVISGLAALVGAVSAGAAWVLVHLIGLVTNLAWYGRVSSRLTVPDPRHLGPLSVLVPVAGGLVVGLLARYGSERIRGHGTPETIEAVLVHGSRIAPRLAVLKPAASAVAIGTGGPFGAEGPIIATGGALGSLLAQALTLSADERKALLVAGAAGGMSAIFGTPVAAVLFAVELLLYEYRPRSLIPVAVASSVAGLLRGPLLGSGRLFPSPSTLHVSAAVDAGCVALGLVAGLLAVVLTRMVSLSESAFERLPVHWMWWPALGGLAIGVGGLLEPQALGVGYPTISSLLTGHGTLAFAAGLLAVKAVIWAIGLGSGTSGGVVAPVLLLGCALGAAAATVLPGAGVGIWPLLGLAALMASTLRAPLTAVVFALELSQRADALPALLLAVIPAYAVTALLVRRGLLTERMDRRGHHVSAELVLDPLEVLLVRDVLPEAVTTLQSDLSLADAVETVLARRSETRAAEGIRQRLYPVVAPTGELVGVFTAGQAVDLVVGRADHADHADFAGPLAPHVRPALACVAPDDTLRTVANRMADVGVTRALVLTGGAVVGVVSTAALLEARLRDVLEERDAERLLRIRVLRRRPGAARVAVTASERSL